MKTLQLCASLLVALLIVACGEKAPEGPTAEQVDSAKAAVMAAHEAPMAMMEELAAAKEALSTAIAGMEEGAEGRDEAQALLDQVTEAETAMNDWMAAAGQVPEGEDVTNADKLAFWEEKAASVQEMATKVGAAATAAKAWMEANMDPAGVVEEVQ